MERKSKNIICILLMVISLLLITGTIYYANKNIEASETSANENRMPNINGDNMTPPDMGSSNNGMMPPDMNGSGEMTPPDMSDSSDSSKTKRFKKGNGESTSKEKKDNDSTSISDEKTILEKPTGEVDDSNTNEISTDSRMMTPPDIGSKDMSAPSMDNQENTKKENKQQFI